MENGSIRCGDTVCIKDLDRNRDFEYELVPPPEVDVSKGKISIASPVGSALLEREEGETVEVNFPNGMMRTYEITKVVHVD